MHSFLNIPLLLGIVAIIVAQILKVPMYYLQTRKWDFTMLRTSGSMPSSHAAGVMAVATSVGFESGFNSPVFAVAGMLAGVVMYDAMGIRFQAGIHANALNQMRHDMTIFFREIKRWPELPPEEKQGDLKTLLGHKPSEVLAGAITGVIVSTIIYFALGK